MDTSPSIPESQSHHQSQQVPSANSGGPQIRSRVTVVCAECKRLKLKCDRRTPCGSCTKRDTVARCVYSPAAAEKVDLHSLNNRLIQVESQLAQFTAPGARSHNFYPNAPGPSHHPDRALLVVGQSGSSLAISLDDITTIWLKELDVGKDILPIQSPSVQSSCPSRSVASHVKLEPSPVMLPTQDPKSGHDLPVHLLVPPLSAYYTSPSPSANEEPSVTSRLLAHIPFAPRKRQKLYDNVEDVLKMHPCFNFKHFKDRAEAMFRWASEVEGTDRVRPDSSLVTSRPTTSSGLPSTSKAETARAIFFGSSSPSSVSTRSQSSSRPTISFFAAVAAAFALGTLVDREIADEEARSSAALHGDGMAVGDSSPSSRPPSRKKPELLAVPGKKCKGVSKDTASSPAVLFALSQQALSLFEKSSPYDLDFLMAMILHVLYALHDSKARAAQNLLPDVGKMINIARTMGLDTDPDEFPGKFNLFDAESRRRLWWDIFYYDLFVSDFMGRSPLISDMEHTTRLPMDVDEDVFTPACTSVPLPRHPLSLLEPNSSDFKYFGLKCRLAQLVKVIKRRSLRDSLQNDSAACDQFTLEQATACADEIKQWLADLPTTFRLDVNSELPNPQSLPPDTTRCSSSSLPGGAAAVSPVLLAQRCELAVIAQRLIMKVYIPFLRPSCGHQGTTTHYQATVGTFTAAHIIIRSLRVLYLMWKQRPDLKGRRPTPALFSFYSFGRSLFDAAVVCAHNVIKDPNSVWVRIAMEDVSDALELMRDPMLNTGRGRMRGGVEGSVHEAIRIVELLQKKALDARTLDVSSAGTKRKHDELEIGDGQSHTGFQFPFVSGSVQSAGTLVQSTSSTASPPDPGPRPIPAPIQNIAPSDMDRNVGHASLAEGPLKRPSSAVLVHSPSGQKHGSGAPLHKAKCKDKHVKKCPYPQSGIRVRPGKEPLQFSRIRFTPSTVPSVSDANTEIAPPPGPPSSQPPSVASTPIIEHPQYQLPLPFAQASHTNLSSDSTANQRHSSAQELPDSVAVDFSLPFGAADQAHAHANIDVSQSRRYNNVEMNADVIEPRQIAKLSPAPSTYDHSQGTSFSSSSPIGQSSGNYSNMSSPFSNGGQTSLSVPHIASNGPAAHDQRSTPFEISASSQTYFAYGPRYQDILSDQSNPMSLDSLSVEPSVTINPGGDDGRFTTGDVTSRDGSFRYSQDKSHHAMYAIKPAEPHPGPPFLDHSQHVSEAWSQESPIPEDSRFWHSYEHFP
ncbi:hypothetical protein F5I97DRAFT_1901712 [Phlebopus sp. FC_14]|nr:hypothetical protein F5I97DRAFT_1901712 [Phlebopus sp. FC_14]